MCVVLLVGCVWNCYWVCCVSLPSKDIINMQKKRWRKLGLMRRVLTCAIFLISLVALFSAHLHLFFPPSQLSLLPDPYKLPTVSQLFLLFFLMLLLIGVIRVYLFLGCFSLFLKCSFAKRFLVFWVMFDDVFVLWTMIELKGSFGCKGLWTLITEKVTNLGKSLINRDFIIL